VVLGVCLWWERQWVDMEAEDERRAGSRMWNVEKDETRDLRTKEIKVVESIVLCQQNECEGIENREGR
jgi:hypothetical protein